MTQRLALFTLGLALVACGGDEGDDPLLLGPVEIGTAELNGQGPFVPLEEGAELELHPGSQGGFHVFIHLQVPAGEVSEMGDRPFVHRLARLVASGDLVHRSVRTQRFVPAARSGFVELESSVPLFLCPTPIGIPVADEELELEIRISADQDGTDPVVGTYRFTPRCPEGEQSQFCRNICYG